MSNELIKLDSREILGKTVTAYGTVENPLFLAKDVADWIEHSNVSAMLESIDTDEKTKVFLPSNHCLEGLQSNTEYWFLTENGLYEVLFLSRKPVAKEFKSGVKQLLHDLRTGKAQVKPTGFALVQEAMQFLIAENAAKDKVIENQQSKIESDKPKVLFSEAVATSNTDILIGELAKILKQNGVDIGQNRLFERLRSEGYLCKSGSAYNTPTQRAMELGLLRVKETAVTHSDGHVTVNITTKVTGKGQIYFINKFLNERAETAIA
jgi:anti-repressor protein